ncbi:MAG: Ras GTPase activating protein ira2, partial [Claussenomyces sp. TS43310]
LPHRTGASDDLNQYDLAILTRNALVDISSTSISEVVESLLRLLHELSSPYDAISSHPAHVLYSELYIIHLIADCCTAHWESINDNGDSSQQGDSRSSSSRGFASEGTVRGRSSTYGPGTDIDKSNCNFHCTRTIRPSPLDDSLVGQLLSGARLFLGPIPDTFVLPATAILDDDFSMPAVPSPNSRSSSESSNPHTSLVGAKETADILREKSDDIERDARSIVEFISASNWTYMLEFLRKELREIRIVQPGQSGSPQHALTTDDDRNSLISLRLVSSLWVSSRKLGLVIQEFCGNFLHFRRPYQHTVAIVLPLLITRWLERNSWEFVDLHITHKRLNGGADTLFDMTNTMIDNVKEKSVLYPLQATLLFLLPDVWEIASGMRDAKSSSMAKKTAFLDGLRKAMRSRNPAAAWCLVSLLRVARHFDLDSEAALLSYALDVQDEIRDAAFRRFAPGIDSAAFDHTLLTAAFVSISHLNFDACEQSLAPLCLATSSPQDFKISFVAACCHFARQTNAGVFTPIFAHESSSQRGAMEGPQLSTKGASEMVASTDLTYFVLTFLDLCPKSLVDEDPALFQMTFAAFVSYLSAHEERIWVLASRISLKIFTNLSILIADYSREVDVEGFPLRFWKFTSVVVLIMSDRVIDAVDHTKQKLKCIYDYLGARLQLLKSMKEVAVAGENSPERIAASAKLETTFLITLCSSDIDTCQLSTACIALLCAESEVIDIAFESTKRSATITKNFDAYIELGSRDFRVTGLVAFQKRLRGIFKRMKQPSLGILAAWDIVFGKWHGLSARIASARFDSIISDQSLVEWRNFSGFLASLGGSCISEQGNVVDESGSAGLKWIDRPLQDNFDETLLDRYLTQSVLLLACSNVRVREAIREVLSFEISPLLYLPLFRILEAQLEALFSAVETPSPASDETQFVFAEQAAALLKTIVERLSTPEEIDAALSIDIGALTLSFARFLNGAIEVPITLKTKLKVCQLCEVITRKKELLNLRHDVRIRNQLLDIMFGWITRPGSPAIENSTFKGGGMRSDEPLRLQRDLDRACLKALSGLTHRLPLQPGEGQSDAETSDLKLQMFRRYFNRFLSLLTLDISERSDIPQSTTLRDDPVTIHELAISALSNLLSANIDVGLKHSLSIGYHEDLKIRTAFVRVLCNILAQGAEFANLSDKAIGEKYDQLLEASLQLLLNNVNLVVALCDACPSTEVDELTISLLNIFDSRGLGFMLLQALIEHEVMQTDQENEAELLRRNCVTTKMLSVYAKWKGSTYLKETLQKVLERLIITAKDLNLELDPSRTASPEELQKNALQLRIVSKVFIDDICNSAAHVPISSSVMTRFPEAKFTAVGAFVFLRFFCPAIVAPEVEGLITSPPSKEIRRGLLLIAKVVQNLANNVLFGAKESYMFPLNDFLTQHIYRVTTFLREISVPPNLTDSGTDMEAFDFGSCVALHRFLYDHWDHVRQKLIAQERQSSVHSPLDISQGRLPILEAVRSLISELGPPPTDISWNRPMISSNDPPSYSRFQHFMLRNSGRSSESLVSTRAVYDGGESKDGLSMICIILRNTDNEAIDYDLLLYCYLKIASRMWHKPFGILIDATCYNGQNEPQDGQFKKLDLLTPSELSKNLGRVYIYNMNSAFRQVRKGFWNQFLG